MAMCIFGAGELSTSPDVCRAENEVVELRRLKARCEGRTVHGRIAMQTLRKKKGVCGLKGHVARDCKSKKESGQSSACGSGSNEASE